MLNLLKESKGAKQKGFVSFSFLRVDICEKKMLYAYQLLYASKFENLIKESMFYMVRLIFFY